jgi:RNA polymerase sigma factor (sigma-70 family)
MISRLAGLPRKQRAAVVLRYYAGLTDREIAAQLGCREPTVRSQIHRALTVLRIDLTSAAPSFQETS